MIWYGCKCISTRCTTLSGSTQCFARETRRASILTSYNALLEPFVATDVSWWGVGGAAFVHFARNESQRFGGGVSLVSTQHDLRLLATCVRPYNDNTPREFTCPLHLQDGAYRRRGVPLNGSKRGGATAKVSTAAPSAQVHSCRT